MLLITVGLAFILELLAVISSYFRIDRPFDTSDAAMAMVAVCAPFQIIRLADEMSYSELKYRFCLDIPSYRMDSIPDHSSHSVA